MASFPDNDYNNCKTDAPGGRPPWTLKDKVFHDLFRDPGYLLSLYQTLHPEDQTATVSDLSDVTIRHVFINGSHNDLGFMVHGQHLILTEAQSTWSDNIVIRQLLYLAETWNAYIKQSKADLYSEHRIYLPRAECYVIYTGKRQDRPEWLSLSEIFFGGISCVDLHVKMIYETAGRDIINQYIQFAEIYDSQVRQYGRSKEAILKALRICKERDILKDYIRTHEMEVYSMLEVLTQEYNDQLQLKLSWENGLAEGREAGRAEGQSNALRTVARNMHALGDSVTDIAARLGVTPQAVTEMLEDAPAK